MRRLRYLPTILVLFIGLVFLLLAGCSSKQTYSQDRGSCPATGTIQKSGIDYSLMEMLAEINSEIGATAGIEAELKIVSGDQPNAFAWQKGKNRYIALNIGLLKMLGENIDEYAFVIAHETAHIKMGHINKRKKYNEGVSKTSGVLSLALEIVGIGFGIPFSGLISSITTDSGAHLMELGYNRDQEREADTNGLKYMAETGFKPNGAITFLNKLLALPNNSSIPFLSTHPNSKERISLLSLEIKNQ
jgi:predicted Zn-dependent protease